MSKKRTRTILWPALLLSTVLAVTACGGGGGDDAPAPPPEAPNIGQSVDALIDFMKSLIAGTSETSEPIDINPLTLATDDTAEPSPL